MQDKAGLLMGAGAKPSFACIKTTLQHQCHYAYLYLAGHCFLLHSMLLHRAAASRLAQEVRLHCCCCCQISTAGQAALLLFC
ncbi:hypothetical protein WJX79_003079 [Trebouxia sp. C0005]